MGTQQELAGHVMVPADIGIMPDSRQASELLSGYRVSRGSGLGSADFLRQIDRFLAEKRFDVRTERTIREYRIQLTAFGEFIGKRAAEITAADIQSYVDYLGGVRHYQKTSLQNIINTVRNFFTWLQAKEAVCDNPAGNIKSFKINPFDTKHPLTRIEMELLRDACKTDRERALLEFLYSSACTGSGCARIGLEDVDFDRRRAFVANAGGKRRTLFFSVKAKILLRQYLAGRDGGTALFCRMHRPYARLGKSTIREIIRELGRRAGIGWGVNTVILRHTLAAELLNAGMDTGTMRKIMGQSVAGASEIYAPLCDDYVIREYDKHLLY